MKPVFLKETVGEYKAGTYVWLGRRNGNYDPVEKQYMHNTYVTHNRANNKYGGHAIADHQWEEPITFIDVECRPVRVGDEICRFNTTDNIQILERRKVLGVTAEGLLLAPKMQGGRTTATSDNSKVMIVSR